MKTKIEQLERTLEVERMGFQVVNTNYDITRHQRDSLKLKVEELERDKAWLKRTVDQLILEPKERSPRS